MSFLFACSICWRVTASGKGKAIGFDGHLLLWFKCILEFHSPCFFLHLCKYWHFLRYTDFQPVWSQDTIPTEIPNSSPCSVGGWRCGTPEGAEESRWYHKGRGLCDLPYRGAGWFSWILTYWMTFCRFCSTHAVCNCGQHYICVSSILFVLSIVVCMHGIYL